MKVTPLTAIVLAALPCAAAGNVIDLRVMAQESLPPKWIVTHGNASGVCPDILAAIARHEPRLRFSGLTNLRSVPVIEQSIQSGKTHVACALLDTPLRRQIATPLPQSLYISRQRIAAAAGDTAAVESMDDLVRLRPLVNTSRGAAYIEQLRERGITVDDSTGSNLTNLKKILAGHGRFFYMNELTLHWLIREHGLQDKVKLMPAILKEDPVYLWVSKKAPPQVVPLLTAAVRKLHENGELARIYARWTDQAGVSATP